MSYKNALPSLERRVRRIAVRQGLNLLKPEKPTKQILAHGGYMLRDVESFAIVFGDKEYLFSATLDEVEEFLLKQGGEDEGEED